MQPSTSKKSAKLRAQLGKVEHFFVRIRRRGKREAMLALLASPLQKKRLERLSQALKFFLKKFDEQSTLIWDDKVWKQIVLSLVKDFSIKTDLGPGALSERLENFFELRPYRIQIPFTKPNAKLKILYVTGMFPSYRHAGGLRMFDIIAQLAKSHDVDLYSNFQPVADGPSLDILRKKLGNVRLVNENVFSGEDAQSWLMQNRIQPEHYDVIAYEYNQSASLINYLRYFTKRSVYTMIESSSKRDYMHLVQCKKENFSPNDVAFYIERIMRVAGEERDGILSADKAIAVTDKDAEFVSKIFGILPDVISSGVSDFAVYDRVEKVKHIEPAPHSLMFLGYYDHYPNVDAVQWYLRNVHPSVKAKIPDVKFYAVGAGNNDALKKEFGNDPTVVFTGEVDDFVPYIAQAKICISPLVSGAGIRGKINQYSAVNRPTVSTKIGVVGLAYVDGESVFVADDPIEFAEKIIKLLTDESLWVLMSTRASELTRKNHSWQSIVQDLERLYVE